MRKRITASAVCSIAVVGVLAACAGSGGDTTGSDSNTPEDLKGTTVTWYFGQVDTDLTQSLVDGFNAVYPEITVNAVSAPSGDLIPRFQTEEDSGAHAADVISMSTYSFFLEAVDKGTFVDLTKEDLPSLEHYSEDAYAEGNIGIRFSANPVTMCYNTDLVPEDKVPHTFEALNDPFFQDGIVTWQYGKSDGMTQFLHVINQTIDNPEQFMQDLADLGIASADPTTSVQTLIAGEYKVAVPCYLVIVKNPMDDGAPVAAVNDLDAATVATYQYLAIPKSAPNPGGARLLADYLMSEDGQHIMAAGVGASFYEGGIEDAVPLPELIPSAITGQTPELDPLAAIIGQ